MGSSVASFDLLEPGSRVAILAAAGKLPLEAANQARNNGLEVLIVKLRGMFDADPGPFEHIEVGLGQFDLFSKLVHQRNVRHVALLGVFHRPHWRDVKWDAGALKAFPKVIGALRSGDSKAMELVRVVIESHGFEIVGLPQIAPGMLAERGQMSKLTPKKVALEEIDLGRQTLHCLDQSDVGQSVVVCRQRVIAIEAAEGTDAMIDRCAELRRNGRFRERVPSGVFIKLPKPSQDLRLDMPAFGLDTIRRIKEAGLAGIALGAGGAVLAEKDACIRAVNDAGLFLIGVDQDQVG